MKFSLLTKTEFEKDFQASVVRVQKRLGAYVKSPTVKNVHDIRTALRRLESVSLVLPKRSRKQLSKYLKLSKIVFKSSTEIRDSDIILERFANYPALERSKIIESLKSKRKKLVSRSSKYARKLRKKTLEFELRGLKDAKLRKRYGKLVDQLNSRIQTLLPIVKDDPKKVDELHLLRKVCKELRYLSELSKDKEQIERLKKWQKHLGDIHDSDVVIAYAGKKAKSFEVAKIIRDLKRSRDEQFEEFVSMLDRPQATPAVEKQPTRQVSSAETPG